jgi:hypothetical protein
VAPPAHGAVDAVAPALGIHTRGQILEERACAVLELLGIDRLTGVVIVHLVIVPAGVGRGAGEQRLQVRVGAGTPVNLPVLVEREGVAARENAGIRVDRVAEVHEEVGILCCCGAEDVEIEAERRRVAEIGVAGDDEANIARIVGGRRGAEAAGRAREHFEVGIVRREAIVIAGRRLEPPDRHPRGEVVRGPGRHRPGTDRIGELRVRRQLHGKGDARALGIQGDHVCPEDRAGRSHLECADAEIEALDAGAQTQGDADRDRKPRAVTRASHRIFLRMVGGHPTIGEGRASRVGRAVARRDRLAPPEPISHTRLTRPPASPPSDRPERA